MRQSDTYQHHQSFLEDLAILVIQRHQLHLSDLTRYHIILDPKMNFICIYFTWFCCSSISTRFSHRSLQSR